jgi:hypothetical protein
MHLYIQLVLLELKVLTTDDIVGNFMLLCGWAIFSAIVRVPIKNGQLLVGSLSRPDNYC